MKRIFFHVGLTKTGSTALQQELFPILPGITYLGAKGSRIEDEELRRTVHRLVHAIGFYSREIVERPKIPARLLRARDQLDALEGNLLFSDEGFTATKWTMGYDRVPLVPQVLHRLFGEECAAIIVLRDPVDYIVSRMLEGMMRAPIWYRAGERRVLADPVRCTRLQLRAAAKGDHRSIFATTCRYDLIVDFYRRALGPDAVHLLAYERLFDETASYRTAFSAIVGAEPAQSEIGRRNVTTDDRRRTAAQRFYGADGDPADIEAFVASWREARTALAGDVDLAHYVERHCAALHRDALAATAA